MPNQDPAPGDLLISRRGADGPYEISIVPGRPQLSVRAKQDAVRQASAYAAKNGATVWLVEGDDVVVRLGAAQKV